MLVKIVSLFLVGMVVLGMFGKLKLKLPKMSRLNSEKCDACGRPRIGKGTCPCGRGT